MPELMLPHIHSAGGTGSDPFAPTAARFEMSLRRASTVLDRGAAPPVRRTLPSALARLARVVALTTLGIGGFLLLVLGLTPVLFSTILLLLVGLAPLLLVVFGILLTASIDLPGEHAARAEMRGPGEFLCQCHRHAR